MLKAPAALLVILALLGTGATAGLILLLPESSEETVPDELARVEALGANRLDASGKVLLGIAITLREEWKTYWRLPWESGIPPLLDWSESGNLESAQAHWPAPQRFEDPGGAYLGYRDALVLPVSAQAVDRSEPLQAELLLRFAVCRHVCVPMEEQLSWSIAPADGTGSGDLKVPGRITEALERVPVEVQTGTAAKARFIDARLAGKNGEFPELEVRVVVSGQLGDTLLVVEEPAPHFFGRERLVKSTDAGGNTQALFSVPLLDPGIAQKMRGPGARLLFRNGDVAISALLPVQ